MKIIYKQQKFSWKCYLIKWIILAHEYITKLGDIHAQVAEAERSHTQGQFMSLNKTLAQSKK